MGGPSSGPLRGQKRRCPRTTGCKASPDTLRCRLRRSPLTTRSSRAPAEQFCPVSSANRPRCRRSTPQRSGWPEQHEFSSLAASVNPLGQDCYGSGLEAAELPEFKTSCWRRLAELLRLPRRPCYRLLPSQSPNASSRVLSRPPRDIAPAGTTCWGDGDISLGRCALRASVEKPVFAFCRPSPYKLGPPPASSVRRAPRRGVAPLVPGGSQRSAKSFGAARSGKTMSSERRLTSRTNRPALCPTPLPLGGRGSCRRTRWVPRGTTSDQCPALANG